jgi:CMP-N-acetylneuraminic acid synthetase
LILYSIEYARKFTADENICLSTDDLAIIEVAKSCGLFVPFIRPAELATDEAASYDVIMHALEFYKSKGRFFDSVILLQPTSPFRLIAHLEDCINIYNRTEPEMVMSVKIAKGNPYRILYKEDENGYISNLMNAGNIHRRQDEPIIYQSNGSIYIMKVKSLEEKHYNSFRHIKKYVMQDQYSIDIDTALDWAWCEFLLEKGILEKTFLNE